MREVAFYRFGDRTLPRQYPAAPAKMKVTAQAIAKIQMALSAKGMNQSQLAE